MSNWSTIQKELEKQSLAPRSVPPEAFWGEFKARARMTVQDEPGKAAHPFLWTSMAFAGAAAILLFIFGFSGNTLAATRVTSLEVEGDHSAAIILNVVSQDGKEAGAIVWVSGLDEESP
jgi:hypothetical protein